jgi:hypothetical protein
MFHITKSFVAKSLCGVWVDGNTTPVVEQYDKYLFRLEHNFI